MSYRGLLALFVALSTAVVCVAAPVPRYDVVDLGIGYAGTVWDVSDSGLAVGHVSSYPWARACIWDQGPQYLSPLGQDNSAAYGVNNAGVIVGSSERTDDQFLHACRWVDGSPAELPVTSEATNSKALAINDEGVSVGSWNTWPAGSSSNVNYHACTWDSSGQFVDLSLPGERASEAVSINRSGQIAGMRFLDTTYHAVLWDGDACQDLGDLYGHGSQATAVNDLRQVVGVSHTSDWDATVGFLFSGGAMQSLASAGHYFQIPRDINDEGVIVGEVYNLSGEAFAAVWWEEEITDLNDLIEPYTSPVYGSMTLTAALAVNENGVIACIGDSPSPFAATRPYLLVPVPEPSTAVLLALGVIVLCAYRRLAATGS